MKRFLFILILLPAICFSQIRIIGRVVNAADNQPVANASAFLSNATIGARSAEDGSFVLTGVRPAQYEFVLSAVGYQPFRQTIMAGTNDIDLGVIKLSVKTTELAEVRVLPDRDREQDLKTFTDDFIGTSQLSKQCRITNPEIIELDYDPATRVLTAQSKDFLLIENKALGYNIKYLLSKFIKDNKGHYLYFEGSALFTEMDGTPSEKRRWQKRRQEAYLGSNMHFLRSVIGQEMEADGFKVMPITRIANVKYLPGIEPEYTQTLVNKPLTEKEITAPTEKRGLFALTYKDPLYVMYTKKKNITQEFSSVNQVSIKSSYVSTVLTFKQPYGLFDNNGVFTNPEAVVFEGQWGSSRFAEMLPVDYQPVISK